MNTAGDFTEPMSIGNPSQFAMIVLSEKVRLLTRGRSKIIFQPLPSDDPEQRQPDSSLANSAISWEPKVALNDGVREMIAYFKRLFEA